MLPPYNTQQAFLKRLFHPWTLIDWHQAVVEFEYALLKPKKLALTRLQRLRVKGHLGHDDPGMFMLLVYLIISSGLTYGLAVYATHRNMISFFSLLQGFMVFPAAVFVLGTTMSSASLFLILKRVSKVRKGSLTAKLGTRVFKKTGDGSLLASTGPSTSAGADQDLFLYCFDLVCNALVPALIVLCPLQYLLLPLVLAGHPDSGPFSKFASTFVANLLHASAAILFTNSISKGLAITPPPINAAAGLVLLPLALWLLTILILTILRINLTSIFFTYAFGYLFRSDLTQVKTNP
ncbi:UNC-50 family protein [Gregarina niphandrodes]|uniref:UNC-50 family protein n=1 Tax=Gregarina niphandrodes TaxID=110365 RepID=A0A023B406_GRENI|nr:UNC-50 family protein [Gregarina niphandrodes]EZG56069.1 UNC-50 family protein [Gregarina niphandrodes]|eukprot:XP_011131358.1 UNC-50 family protein [Gregarina niphandrodes]